MVFIFKMEQEVEEKKESKGKKFWVYGIVLILILGVSVVATLYSSGTYQEIPLLNNFVNSISSSSIYLQANDNPEIKYPANWERKNTTDKLDYFIIVTQALKKEHNDYRNELCGENECSIKNLKKFRNWQENNWNPRNSAIGNAYALERDSLPEPKENEIKYARSIVIKSLTEQEVNSFDVAGAFK